MPHTRADIRTAAWLRKAVGRNKLAQFRHDRNAAPER